MLSFVSHIKTLKTEALDTNLRLLLRGNTIAQDGNVGGECGTRWRMWLDCWLTTPAAPLQSGARTPLEGGLSIWRRQESIWIHCCGPDRLTATQATIQDRAQAFILTDFPPQRLFNTSFHQAFNQIHQCPAVQAPDTRLASEGHDEIQSQHSKRLRTS